MKIAKLVCRVFGHRFTGWSNQNGYIPGFPLPVALCERCGREF